jgi:hypothetical protein
MLLRFLQGENENTRFDMKFPWLRPGDTQLNACFSSMGLGFAHTQAATAQQCMLGFAMPINYKIMATPKVIFALPKVKAIVNWKKSNNA